MQQPWESDDCAPMKAHYAVFSVPEAAALWCGVPDTMLSEIVTEARQLSTSGSGRGVWKHYSVPCMEARSRAIAEAIESGELPHGREDGETLAGGDIAAAERRHVFGRELKKWLQRSHPNERPAFLFDEIERSSHTAISADAYRALKIEHDKLEKRLGDARAEYRKLRDKKKSIESERDSLRAIVENTKTPSERATSTYHNIIAALLDVIGGRLPDVEGHPSVASEAKLIEIIEHHYRGYGGLSKSNLSRKFPEAKRALASS